MSLTISTPTDLSCMNKVMSIVKTFGADERHLNLIEDYISKELSDLGSGRLLFLAESDEQPVGMAQLVLGIGTDAHLGHIHSMQTAKTHQRNGVGTKIIHALEVKAADLKLKKLTLAVDADNEGAINLYHKAGFTKMDEIKKGNSTLLFLSKSL